MSLVLVSLLYYLPEVRGLDTLLSLDSIPKVRSCSTAMQELDTLRSCSTQIREFDTLLLLHSAAQVRSCRLLFACRNFVLFTSGVIGGSLWCLH